MVIDLCLKCEYFTHHILGGCRIRNPYGYWAWLPEELHYYCRKKLGYIRRLRKKCKDFTPYTQARLNIGDDGMVKLAEVPSEGARLDLNNLPEEIELIALEEKMIEETVGKSGGLKITYKNREDAKVAQKYTAISGAVLTTALKALKVKDTLELQETWYHYTLTKMRMGYPRYIPIEKCKKQ